VAWDRRKVTVTSATIVAALLAYLVFSLLVAVSGPCTDKFSKLLITGPILAFLALIGFEAGRQAMISDWLDLQKTATWILLAAFRDSFWKWLCRHCSPIRPDIDPKASFRACYGTQHCCLFSFSMCRSAAGRRE